MTTQEFKRVARILKEVYAALEQEALSDGVDIFGEEFIAARDALRLEVLKRLGFTIEEYREAKELVAPAKKVDVAEQVSQVASEASTMASETRNIVDALSIPDEEDLLEKAREIAESVVKPPVIQNNIVERTVVEKPTIVKETITVVEKEEYEDGPLRADIAYLMDRVDELAKQEPEEEDDSMEEFEKELAVMQEVLRGMPDFRKLGMGLQQQIDTKVEGVNVKRIIYSATEPGDAREGDVWLSP